MCPNQGLYAQHEAVAPLKGESPQSHLKHRSRLRKFVLRAASCSITSVAAGALTGDWLDLASYATHLGSSTSGKVVLQKWQRALPKVARSCDGGR